jgi:hypothetical protein
MSPARLSNYGPAWHGPKFKRARPARNSNKTGLFGLGPGQARRPECTPIPVHLPNENYIIYNAASNISRILSEGFVRKTMLTEWFYVNSTCESTRNLTYIEFPSKWRWEDKTRSWKPRHAKERKIGRTYYVHPSTRERYNL